MIWLPLPVMTAVGLYVHVRPGVPCPEMKDSVYNPASVLGGGMKQADAPSAISTMAPRQQAAAYLILSARSSTTTAS